MKKILLLILLISKIIFAQEVIDKIVAIVDNEIIMLSELKVRTAIIATQRNLNPDDAKLMKTVLNSIIDEKLLYAQAKLDSIDVQDEMVNSELDRLIGTYVQQYGSREAVEKLYGMSIEKLKREFKEDTRKRLMTRMVQQKKFGSVEASRREVEEFFNSFKDSLGMIPEKVTIAHIFKNPKVDKRIKNKTKAKAQVILDSLKNGADFAELAKKLSEDPGSKDRGGDLGWIKRGVFDPAFEAAVFALVKGELSEVIESSFGYHIIQLLDRRGESVHARHILFALKSDDESELNSIEFLSGIRDSILQKKNTFEYYAKKYSDDKQTAALGGELGTFELSQLDKQFAKVVFSMKKGDISFPKRLQLNRVTYGFHIVKLIDRVPAHLPDIDKDYQTIKQIADYQKKEKVYNQWMKALRDKIYWEIKL